MARMRTRLLLATSAVFALCSLASMPAAAEADEQYAEQLVAVEQSADLIAVYDLGEVTAVMVAPDRLPESPGGECAIGAGSSNTQVTDNEKEVLPGGAAGVADIGIRGPTAT